MTTPSTLRTGDATESSEATSTATDAATAPAPDTAAPARLPEVRPASRVRQARALAGGEWRLLRRNKVALLNTLLAPALMVGLFSFLRSPSGPGLGQTAPLLTLGMALIFVVYYTLVTALVARREALVLQRLRSGEASDTTILVGLSLPFVAITIVQTVLCVALAVLFLGAAAPTNVALLLVAMVSGSVVWALLGIVSTSFTRSVEHAQITTMPLIFVALLLSGISFPLWVLPPWAQVMASLTPMHPVVELMSLGMTGMDAHGQAHAPLATFGAAVQPVAILVGWTVVGVWLTRRLLSWEPRR